MEVVREQDPWAADLSGEVWPEKHEDSRDGGLKGQQACKRARGHV